MSCSQCAVAVLLVALVVGVQGHQIIYVDTENGTFDSSCWEGGLDQPCGSLELADTGAKRYNSTIALVLRYATSRNTAITAPTTQQALSCQALSCLTKRNELANYTSCPPWFEQSSGICKCGESIHDIVKCNETLQQSFILSSYCMTYNETTGAVVGACFYNCIHSTLKDVVYRAMPKTVEHLNDAMCGHFNRSGQLCGKCRTGFNPPVYSYDLHCTLCSDDQYNWIKYVAIAFVPLTVFLILVLCCRISATSPQLYMYVTFSQALATPANVRILLIAAGKSSYSRATILVRILSTLYGFWNLDFFRALLPHHICLKVDTLQVLALDYSIAFYPLTLIVVTYVLIEFHTYNFRFIVWIWRPIHKCFARFRQQWDIRTSTIDAFATFILLSNIKLLSVSFDLLTPTFVYNMNNTVVGTFLYYDASVEYFGKKHLPYAVLAVFVVLIFILFPILLLLLYPMRCFQRSLDHCRVRWHALHIFIDAFQGCYKDGTNGSLDCRYFAGLYLLMRLILFILFALTHSAYYYAVGILVLIGVAMLLAIFQPYKAEFSTYNAVDSVFILTLAMWYGTVLCLKIAAVKIRRLLKTSAIVSFLVATLPLLYFGVVILHWICTRRGVGQRLFQSIKGRIGGKAYCTGLEESLPDRLINPSLYHDDGDYPMANYTERFNNQAYTSINSEESTMTS